MKTDDVLELTLEPITRMQLIKYAGASGDFNPIHLIDEKAKETGLPGIIAHGMLTMGFMARLFSKMIEKGDFIKEISSRFTAKVFLGDVLTVRAEKKHEDAQTKSRTYEVIVVNQKDQVVAKGEATLSSITS